MSQSTAQSFATPQEKWKPLARRQRELYADLRMLHTAIISLDLRDRNPDDGPAYREKEQLLQELEEERMVMYCEAASSIGTMLIA